MDDDLFIMTSDGVVIRMAASTIRVCGRASQGVILVRLGDDGAGNTVAFLEVTGTDGVPVKSRVEESEMRGMPIIPFGQGGTPNAADFAALLFPPAKEEETESAVARSKECL